MTAQVISAYHGTTCTFDEFTLELSSPYGRYGPLLYFSSERSDAETYTDVSNSDKESSIEEYSRIHNIDLDSARDLYIQNEGRVFSVELRPVNPVVFNKTRGTYRSILTKEYDELSNEELEDCCLENYLDDDFYQTIQNFFSGISNSAWEEVYPHDFKFSFTKGFKVALEYGLSAEYSKMLQESFGYDLIIDQLVPDDLSHLWSITRDTIHYGVLNPEIIKIIEVDDFKI